ncbi:hypothetical protein A3A66_00795 [Microgenomates group bacterium RIFCSPLOWO2_01_FULL_46_13]|nr:MAG: hypothetical protein A3A66_00795 [Microgenomates group bacterium RIFCSPLOWO2_01_FULL_46_13]
MRSPIYWHPTIYTLFMRALCFGYYNERYQEVADLIPSNSSVLDVCCGDCKLFDYIKFKKVTYVGVDFNKVFVDVAKKRGLHVQQANVLIDNLPQADYIVMISSLYQFIPHHQQMIEKLLSVSKKAVIIRECVKSHSTSPNPLVSTVGKLLNNPGDGMKTKRFNKLTLKKALKPFKDKISHQTFAKNDIDYIVMIKP